MMGAMRVVHWAVFSCVLLGLTGIFLPFVQFGLAGTALSDKSSLSFYGAVNNATFVERLVSKVDGARAERLALALTSVLDVGPGKGLAREVASAREAITDFRRAKEDAHLDALGKAVVAVGWSFLLLHLVIAWLILKGLVSSTARRRPIVVAAVLFGIAAAVSTGLVIAVTSAIDEVNAEVGTKVLSLGVGSNLMLAGSAAGCVLAIVLAVRWPKRGGSDGATPSPSPSPG